MIQEIEYDILQPKLRTNSQTTAMITIIEWIRGRLVPPSGFCSDQNSTWTIAICSHVILNMGS